MEWCFSRNWAARLPGRGGKSTEKNCVNLVNQPNIPAGDGRDGGFGAIATGKGLGTQRGQSDALTIFLLPSQEAKEDQRGFQLTGFIHLIPFVVTKTVILRSPDTSRH